MLTSGWQIARPGLNSLGLFLRRFHPPAGVSTLGRVPSPRTDKGPSLRQLGLTQHADQQPVHALQNVVVPVFGADGYHADTPEVAVHDGLPNGQIGEELVRRVEMSRIRSDVRHTQRRRPTWLQDAVNLIEHLIGIGEMFEKTEGLNVVSRRGAERQLSDVCDRVGGNGFPGVDVHEPR